MPKILPGAIARHNLQDKVLGLLNQNLTPDEVADSLNQDTLAKASIQGEGRQGFLAEDIRLFIADQSSIQAEQLKLAVRESPMAKELVHQVREVLTKQVNNLERWDGVASMLLSDLITLRDRAMSHSQNVCVECGGTVYEYPTKAIDTAARALKTTVDLVKSISGDEKFQSVVKAQSFTVNQGITQEELQDTLFQVGRELGHERTEVLIAYSKVLGRKPVEVIDAEPA